jgi:phage terminase small subunit
MPVLTNPKQELFCQEIAKGKTADEAYVLAGYKENRGNASTLKSNQIISDRIAEILERAANRVEVSVSSITERLIRISETAEAIGEPAGLSVARQAAMDAAKLHGLIVEKKETGKPGDFSRMDEHELDDFIAREKVALGGGHSRETPQDHQEGMRKPSGLH